MNRKEGPSQSYTHAAETNEKKLSKRQAAKEFGFSESTLRSYLKKLANDQMATDEICAT